jgi:hypothetical protein
VPEKKQDNGALWRAADIAALEAKIKAIQIWIAHTNNLIEIFEGRDDVLKELRSVLSLVRMRQNDLQTAADKIQAELVGRE